MTTVAAVSELMNTAFRFYGGTGNAGARVVRLKIYGTANRQSHSPNAAKHEPLLGPRGFKKGKTVPLSDARGPGI
jgi:hypothetical protein